MEIRTGPTALTIHSGDRALICQRNATISADHHDGFYCGDTRLVSGLRVLLANETPEFVNSTVVHSYCSRFELLNHGGTIRGGDLEPRSLHLRIDRQIGAHVDERYTVNNYNDHPVELDLQLEIASDFADIFDVKAGRRVRRGTVTSEFDPDESVLTNAITRGEFRRSVRIVVDDVGVTYANGALTFPIELDAHGSWTAQVRWVPDGGFRTPARQPAAEERGPAQWRKRITQITMHDVPLDAVLDQALEDLASLRLRSTDDDASADEVESWVPAAGVPWFMTLFGRDALIVGLQTMLIGPGLGRGAAQAHARLQGDRYDDRRDEQPGKIEHEVRHGVLAYLHEIPQTPYYGSHDAPALFVQLVGALWDWTTDVDLVRSLRPNVERALAWIDRDGDLDGDGLQEYKTRAGDWGFYNLSWKDAGDAIVDEHGARPSLPIATCELQGYVVAAKERWARVLEDAFGDAAQARRLRDESRRLRDAIEARFWWEDEHTYVLGLDGDKKPIRTIASNAGHLLWTGAIVPERAEHVVRRLMEPDLWSGWGIRTLSTRHPAFNPFSYQRGSVWPHDNAIIAAGCSRYGRGDIAARIARGIFDAALRFEHTRLPEVFAGVERDDWSVPVRYVGANVPQAWAAGSVVHLMQTLTGIEVTSGQLDVAGSLPEWLSRVDLRSLRVAGRPTDLDLTR